MHFFKKIIISLFIFTFLPHAISIAAEPISPNYEQVNQSTFTSTPTP
ncbi:hypothetical protein MXM48_04080 [Mammaliicoccus sciuri]|nr:hypothetical protein [Mammaliicoccus sciuri]MCD3219783.1 hypothetical protein [Mammaliicoccus sciuri]MCD8883164.1 hypothetical protein [Mammaliicoccus sciuri]MCJ0924913.1 hypothetical protein [Mammaliicoccus sciuri]MDO0956455.1 hypothetical protein [Mammaliicoccus sciuri]MEB6095761.1 hypothetical protein [Mammaliicoccus sciuri]